MEFITSFCSIEMVHFVPSTLSLIFNLHFLVIHRKWDRSQLPVRAHHTYRLLFWLCRQRQTLFWFFFFYYFPAASVFLNSKPAPLFIKRLLLWHVYVVGSPAFVLCFHFLLCFYLALSLPLLSFTPS